MTFDDVISLYLQAKRHEVRSQERDLNSLARLKPHFSGRRIVELRRLDVRGYIDRRLSDGVKPSTINRELDLPSAAINFVRFSHEIELPNPFHRMSLKVPEGRVRWITRKETDSLIAAAALNARTPHLPEFVRLALHTGCRKSELLTLEWKNVNFEHGFFELQGNRTKNGRRRAVPLNEISAGALRNLRRWNDENCKDSTWVFTRGDGKRMTTFQKGFSSACERAGIEDFRIHDLRHTFASWLVMKGVSLSVVRDLLGHRSIEMTERYAHLAPDQLRTAVQMLLHFE